MEDRRTNRLRWMQREGCIHRLRTFDEAITVALERNYADGDMPLPLDLVQYVEIQTLIGLPPTAQLPVESYLALLPFLIQQWLLDVDVSLRTLADPSWQPGAAPPNPPFNRLAAPDLLFLARSIFLCERCRKTFHAFELLAHPCLHSEHPYRHAVPEDVLPSSDGRLPQIEGSVIDSARLAHYHGRQPWSPAYLCFHGHIADTIIRLCDKDPHTASIAELDFCKARLICRSCSVATRRVLVMDWRAAVRIHASVLPSVDLTLTLVSLRQIDHIFNIHAHDYALLDNAFRKAPFEVSLAARQVERNATNAAHPPIAFIPGWECPRCMYGRLCDWTRNWIVKHMLEAYVGTLSQVNVYVY